MIRLCIILLFFVFQCFSLLAQDLPENVVANEQLISAGSFIIPLDNEKQSTALFDDEYNVNFTGFNLASYGLVYRFLENDIPVQWIIKADKVHDEIDFSALSRQLFPVPGSSQLFDYRSSAFVIKAEDVQNLGDCGDAFSPSLDAIFTFALSNNVAVYQLDEPTLMDVRHELERIPLIAVLSDGPTDGEPHFLPLNEAKIPFDLLSSGAFFQEYNCYTFISQPHLQVINNNQYIPSLTAFLNDGGNFLAHCISVQTFEQGGEYLTTDGLQLASGDGDDDNESYSLFVADMPIMQFQGEILPSLKGQLSSYELELNSNWNPESYIAITNQSDEYVLSGGDVNGAQLGGNIFYLGGHEINSECFEGYLEEQDPNPSEEDFAKIQQFKRVYLNAVFVPADISFTCAGDNRCVCPGDSVQIGCQGLPDDGSILYTWSPGETLDCETCPNPMARPDTTTTYTLSSSDDCSSSEVTVFVLTDIGTITTSGGGKHCGEGANIEFAVSDLDAAIPKDLIIYLDNVPIDTVPVSTNPLSYLSFDPGIYTVQLLQDLACSLNYQGSAEITLADQFDLDIGPDTLICPGESLNVLLEVDSLAVVLWEDGSSALERELVTAGEYWVFVQYDGCERIDSINLDFLSEPTFDLGPDILDCEGTTVFLDAGTDQVLWQDGSTSAIYEVDTSGIYSATLTGEDCFAVDTIEVQFAEAPPAIDLGPDLEFCLNVEAILGGNVEGDYNYIWNTGATSQNLIVNAPGIYWLEINNNCGAERDTIIITTEFELVEDDLYKLPTAFSPNGDGLNDEFRPIPVLDITPTRYDFHVYNRWGNLIYRTSNPNDFWNGIDGSTESPVGVFLWLVEVEFEICGERQTYFDSGNVTLIR